MNKNLIVILSLLLLSVLAKAEMSLNIEPLSGTEKQYAESIIGKICFQNKQVCLYDKQGIELGRTPISEIDRIVFKGVAEILTETNETQQHVLVYPNPAMESIIVSHVPSGQTIRVFDLQGRILQSVEVAESEDTQINVSALPQGSYLLQIGAQIVKFSKK